MNEIIKNETSGEVSAIMVAEEKSSVNLDGWLAHRDEFKTKVVSKMVEGKHYHIMNFKGKTTQVLSKGGAEMVATAFGWTAEFVKDSETWEMLGSKPGIVCYVCNLKNGKFVGQGRGARQVIQDAGDVNKTIKMAQKSAFTDAVLRTSGLSDLFTQDLEDMPQQEQSSQPVQQYNQPTGSRQPSDKQKMFIEKLCKEKSITQTQLKELAITYKGNPSGLIEFLLGYKKQDLPVIQQEPTLTQEQREMQDLVDSIPF